MKLRRSTYYSKGTHRAHWPRWRLGVVVVGSRRDRFLRRRNAVLLALVLACVGLVLLALTHRGSAAPGNENTESAVNQVAPKISEANDNVVAAPMQSGPTSELMPILVNPGHVVPLPKAQAITNILRFKIAMPKGSRAGGDVYCGLFDEAGWPWHPLVFDIRGAKGTEVTCEFHELKPGAYAIAAYFDRNGNRNLDRNWFGMPKEPWVLSRGVRPGLPVPPSFNAVRFYFEGGAQEIDAALQG